MTWNKLTLKKITHDEMKIYGKNAELVWDGFTPNIYVWQGQTPKLNEYVVMKTHKYDIPTIDQWTQDEYGNDFSDYNCDDCYWMSVPEFNEQTWNKLTTREATEEDKEFFGESVDFVWDGLTPDIGEYVIVMCDKYDTPSIDEWTEIGDGVGFDNYAAVDDCYWLSIPEFDV